MDFHVHLRRFARLDIGPIYLSPWKQDVLEKIYQRDQGTPNAIHVQDTAWPNAVAGRTFLAFYLEAYLGACYVTQQSRAARRIGDSTLIVIELERPGERRSVARLMNAVVDHHKTTGVDPPTFVLLDRRGRETTSDIRGWHHSLVSVEITIHRLAWEEDLAERARSRDRHPQR